jgi:DNA invertase Pin-like site-specific DNA recombinase
VVDFEEVPFAPDCIPKPQRFWENGGMGKRTRVGLYARVSTKDQHCSQQLQELRAYAEARGWDAQGEYVDRGVSGAKDSRPAMNRLMDAARKRVVDAIVCSKMDRWGRSMPHFVSSVQELRGLGVRFVAVSQRARGWQATARL